jgi:hypothetical protein
VIADTVVTGKLRISEEGRGWLGEWAGSAIGGELMHQEGVLHLSAFSAVGQRKSPNAYAAPIPLPRRSLALEGQHLAESD